jgi:hypothetical protein
MFYVDDGLVAAWMTSEADGMVDLVGRLFKTCKLGEPQGFLGIEICRDWDVGTIKICQGSIALAEELGVCERGKWVF